MCKLAALLVHVLQDKTTKPHEMKTQHLQLRWWARCCLFTWVTVRLISPNPFAASIKGWRMSLVVFSRNVAEARVQRSLPHVPSVPDVHLRHG